MYSLPYFEIIIITAKQEALYMPHVLVRCQTISNANELFLIKCLIQITDRMISLLRCLPGNFGDVLMQ